MSSFRVRSNGRGRGILLGVLVLRDPIRFGFMEGKLRGFLFSLWSWYSGLRSIAFAIHAAGENFFLLPRTKCLTGYSNNAKLIAQ